MYASIPLAAITAPVAWEDDSYQEIHTHVTVSRIENRIIRMRFNRYCHEYHVILFFRGH